MSTPHPLSVGREGLRARRRDRDATTAVVNPLIPAIALRPAAIARCLEDLHAQGVTRVITGALHDDDQVPFRLAGFTVHQQLRLLSHDLDHLPTTTRRTRRARVRRDVGRVAAVDARAFGEAARFDADDIVDAYTATPSRRFRVIDDPLVRGRHPRAYAICGQSGSIGYLQRLAVDPDAQHGGMATALVLDGLHWMRRRRATKAMVNTELVNDVARSLYEHLGFVELPERLAILTRETVAC